MSLTMKNITFISGMILLFFGLWGTSLFSGAPRGYYGFGESTDISPDDSELVFSYNHDGDAALYTVSSGGGKAERLATPEEGGSYINPKFSPNGERIAFVEQWEADEQPYGRLMIMDRAGKEIKELTDEDGLVTETAFSPDGESLYFLKADVFENYSPIASERPHDFDVFRLNLKAEEIEQITFKEAYDMSALAVTPDGNSLMYKSYGNGDQLIFHSLEDGSETTIVPDGDFASAAPIISSPVLSGDGEHVVFSDVATKNESGTFIYEGFVMDLETTQAEQITSFGEHVTSPVFFHNEDKLIVTVNEKFARGEPEYDYWQISVDGEQQDRVRIEMPD